MRHSALLLLAFSFFLSPAAAACKGESWGHATPKLAAGWSAYPLKTSGLSAPRHLVVDSAGNLLIAGKTQGIVRVTTGVDDEGCVSEKESINVIEHDEELGINHGIALSEDGKLLFASSMTHVYVWDYDVDSGEVSNRRTVVEDIHEGSHVTRTLLIPRENPDKLLVSSGSDGNMDMECLEPARCNIKVFDIGTLPEEPYNFARDGEVLGWGLRNSVGLAEDSEGGIWSVENSADNIHRDGEDIHEDNPAEELNYHGILGSNSNNRSGENYGYPICFATWDIDDIPNAQGLERPDQFVLEPNSTFSDADCQDRFIRPELVMQPHTAPLDIKFYRESTGNSSSVNYVEPCDGLEQKGGLECRYVDSAFITFHGSWNREDPVGYAVGLVEFEDAGKIQTKDSDRDYSPLRYIFEPEDVDNCPEDCARPVGIAFGRGGHIFVTSDSTDTLFVIMRNPDETDSGQGGRDDQGDRDDNDDSESGAGKIASLGLVYTFVVSFIFALL